MRNATETMRNIPATTTQTTTAINTTTNPALFAKELQNKMTDETNTPASTLKLMAADFPNADITVENINNFGNAKSHSSSSTAHFSINLDQDVLNQMTENADFYAEVKELTNRLLEAGQKQNLVNAGGASITRNVSITAAGVRYVEVQRGADGTQLSVSSLATQTDKTIADLLEKLIETIRANRNGETPNADNPPKNATNSSPFDWLLASESWRFESYLSASANSTSPTFRQVAGQQVAQQRETLELTLNLWAAGGGETDLAAYMEIMGLCDPLALDLDGKGITLSSAEDGVYFDIKGDGSPVRTAFIQGNTAFLYLDGNGNGVVDDVNELFGDRDGYANGFENLARHDDNGDGIIDANDAIYNDLRVWRDLDGDGINQTHESMSLAEAGVASINLNYKDEKTLDQHGNVIGERSTFTRTDGSAGDIVDVWLRNIGS